MRPNGENLSTSLFEYNASNSLENWRVIMQATAGAFRAKLTDLLQLAESAGFDAVEISAGKLHRLVGGYPGTNHRKSWPRQSEHGIRIYKWVPSELLN